MTTITETTATLDADTIEQAIRSDVYLGGWSTVINENTSRGAARLAELVLDVTDRAAITDTQIMEAWRDAFPQYNSHRPHNQHVVRWARERLFVIPVSAEFRTMNAEDMLMLFGATDLSTEFRESNRFTQAVAVLNYQMDRWRREVGLPDDEAKAVDQFWRRMEREYSINSARPASRMVIEHTVRQAYRGIVRGLAPERIKATNDQPVTFFLESAKERDLGLDTPLDLYPIVVYTARGIREANTGEVAGARFEKGMSKDALIAALANIMGSEWSQAFVRDTFNGENAMQIHDMVHRAFVYFTEPMRVGAGSVPAYTPPEPEEFSDITEWMLSKHDEGAIVQKAGSLERDSLENGILDFIDAVKAGEVTAETDHVEVLRRQVRAYGWLKFTGKIGRSMLDLSLKNWAEPLRGVGLTSEEWQTRWARRDKAIARVSGRYGVEQNLCSVLEQAMKELGVKPEREPKRMVTFKNSGIEVVVEVESWSNDSYTLRDKATRTWNSMSEEAKKAAIVKYEPTDIPWDRLTPEV